MGYVCTGWQGVYISKYTTIYESLEVVFSPNNCQHAALHCALNI
jgi:hypothetical protein